MPDLSSEGTGIELGEHSHFEHRWRSIQWIIFSIMGLLVVAALLGFLGSGPLAAQQNQYSRLPLTVDYQRFARVQATNRVVMEPHGAAPGQLFVHLDRALVEGMGIDGASPSPLASASDDGGTLYVFALAPGATGPIVFKAKPLKPGLARGVITVNGEAKSVTQIVWP